MATSTSLADWISARAAARRTGLPEKKVPRMAAMGLLTVLRPPEGVGGQVKYSRESVEALARALVTPASAEAVAALAQARAAKAAQRRDEEAYMAERRADFAARAQAFAETTRAASPEVVEPDLGEDPDFEEADR